MIIRFMGTVNTDSRELGTNKPDSIKGFAHHK